MAKHRFKPYRMCDILIDSSRFSRVDMPSEPTSLFKLNKVMMRSVAKYKLARTLHSILDKGLEITTINGRMINGSLFLISFSPYSILVDQSNPTK